MKKIIIVLIAMLFLVTGCQKQEEKSVDFWMAIVDATKDQLEDNWYHDYFTFFNHLIHNISTSSR